MTRAETEITAFLERLGVEYKILGHESPAFTSEKAASLRDVPREEMVKTMVFLDDDRDLTVGLVPASHRVDLKQYREAAEIESLKFADEETIEDELGYEIGAIPPFFPGTDAPIYADARLFRNTTVNFSAGVPEAGLEVSVEAFEEIMDAVDAETASIAGQREETG